MNPPHPSGASLSSAPVASRLSQFYALTKPRVIQLIVFCALIGMVLAVPGVPTWADVRLALIACAGIWLVAGAAAAFNCLVEQQIDAKMRRTAWRPTARGQLSNPLTLAFSAGLCVLGSWILYVWVNPLTMWLTFATFVGWRWSKTSSKATTPALPWTILRWAAQRSGFIFWRGRVRSLPLIL